MLIVSVFCLFLSTVTGNYQVRSTHEVANVAGRHCGTVVVDLSGAEKWG